MTALRSIAYVSTALIPMTAPALESLFIESRALNIKSGTSGALLCADGIFMQCIEGESSAVEQAWSRIRKSSRHTDVFELLDSRIPSRCFGGFQMGVTRKLRSHRLMLTTEAWVRTSRRIPSADCDGLSLLVQFWRNASGR